MAEFTRIVPLNKPAKTNIKYTSIATFTSNTNFSDSLKKKLMIQYVMINVQDKFTFIESWIETADISVVSHSEHGDGLITKTSAVSIQGTVKVNLF